MAQTTAADAGAQGREIPRYWVGYYDASPRKSVPAVGFKRRKITPCDEEEDEEV